MLSNQQHARSSIPGPCSDAGVSRERRIEHVVLIMSQDMIGSEILVVGVVCIIFGQNSNERIVIITILIVLSAGSFEDDTAQLRKIEILMQDILTNHETKLCKQQLICPNIRNMCKQTLVCSGLIDNSIVLFCALNALYRLKSFTVLIAVFDAERLARAIFSNFSNKSHGAKFD